MELRSRQFAIHIVHANDEQIENPFLSLLNPHCFIGNSYGIVKHKIGISMANYLRYGNISIHVYDLFGNKSSLLM